MWLFTKADKTHITMVQEDKKPFACPVCYVKYMFIERHIGSVHERKKSVNRSYQRKTTLCQTLILNNICLYIYKNDTTAFLVVRLISSGL